jgi:hypothetical protein
MSKNIKYILKNIKLKKKLYIYQDIKNIILDYNYEKERTTNNNYCSCEMCDGSSLYY